MTKSVKYVKNEKGEKVKVLTESDTPYLYSDCVSALCEDSKGNCWVGCRGGMGISLADGGHYRFGTLSFAGGGLADWYHVKDIVEDADGSFWIATANYGIIHIMGDVQHPETLKYSNYSYNNGQLATNSVLCLHVDKSGRLWAGTEGGGLYLYDYKENSLVFIVLLHKRGHILYFGCTLSHLIIIKLEFTFREMISSFWQCQSDNLVNLVHVLPLRQEYVWRYHKW